MDSSQATVTVELALLVGSDPIAGELRPAAGPPRPFIGWVALVRTLEEAINAFDPAEGR